MEDSLEMCRGQGIDIYWRDNLICPTEEQYYKMLEQSKYLYILFK